MSGESPLQYNAALNWSSNLDEDDDDSVDLPSTVDVKAIRDSPVPPVESVSLPTGPDLSESSASASSDGDESDIDSDSSSSRSGGQDSDSESCGWSDVADDVAEHAPVCKPASPHKARPPQHTEKVKTAEEAAPPVAREKPTESVQRKLRTEERHGHGQWPRENEAHKGKSRGADSALITPSHGLYHGISPSGKHRVPEIPHAHSMDPLRIMEVLHARAAHNIQTSDLKTLVPFPPKVSISDRVPLPMSGLLNYQQHCLPADPPWLVERRMREQLPPERMNRLGPPLTAHSHSSRSLPLLEGSPRRQRGVTEKSRSSRDRAELRLPTSDRAHTSSQERERSQAARDRLSVPARKSSHSNQASSSQPHTGTDGLSDDALARLSAETSVPQDLSRSSQEKRRYDPPPHNRDSMLNRHFPRPFRDDHIALGRYIEKRLDSDTDASKHKGNTSVQDVKRRSKGGSTRDALSHETHRDSNRDRTRVGTETAPRELSASPTKAKHLKLPYQSPASDPPYAHRKPPEPAAVTPKHPEPQRTQPSASMPALVMPDKVAGEPPLNSPVAALSGSEDSDFEVSVSGGVRAALQSLEDDAEVAERVTTPEKQTWWKNKLKQSTAHHRLSESVTQSLVRPWESRLAAAAATIPPAATRRSPTAPQDGNVFPKKTARPPVSSSESTPKNGVRVPVVQPVLEKASPAHVTPPVCSDSSDDETDSGVASQPPAVSPAGAEGRSPHQRSSGRLSPRTYRLSMATTSNVPVKKPSLSEILNLENKNSHLRDSRPPLVGDYEGALKLPHDLRCSDAPVTVNSAKSRVKSVPSSLNVATAESRITHPADSVNKQKHSVDSRIRESESSKSPLLDEELSSVQSSDKRRNSGAVRRKRDRNRVGPREHESNRLRDTDSDRSRDRDSDSLPRVRSRDSGPRLRPTLVPRVPVVEATDGEPVDKIIPEDLQPADAVASRRKSAASPDSDSRGKSPDVRLRGKPSDNADAASTSSQRSQTAPAKRDAESDLPKSTQALILTRRKRLRLLKNRKHKNIVDPVLLADVEELVRMLHTLALPRPVGRPAPATDPAAVVHCFQIRKYGKKRKQQLEKAKVEKEADDKNKRKTKKEPATGQEDEAKEQCLPLKKRSHHISQAITETTNSGINPTAELDSEKSSVAKTIDLLPTAKLSDKTIGVKSEKCIKQSDKALFTSKASDKGAASRNVDKPTKALDSKDSATDITQCEKAVAVKSTSKPVSSSRSEKVTVHKAGESTAGEGDSVPTVDCVAKATEKRVRVAQVKAMAPAGPKQRSRARSGQSPVTPCGSAAGRKPAAKTAEPKSKPRTVQSESPSAKSRLRPAKEATVSKQPAQTGALETAGSSDTVTVTEEANKPEQSSVRRRGRPLKKLPDNVIVSDKPVNDATNTEDSVVSKTSVDVPVKVNQVPENITVQESTESKQPDESATRATERAKSVSSAVTDPAKCASSALTPVSSSESHAQQAAMETGPAEGDACIQPAVVKTPPDAAAMVVKRKRRKINRTGFPSNRKKRVRSKTTTTPSDTVATTPEAISATPERVSSPMQNSLAPEMRDGTVVVMPNAATCSGLSGASDTTVEKATEIDVKASPKTRNRSDLNASASATVEEGDKTPNTAAPPLKLSESRSSTQEKKMVSSKKKPASVAVKEADVSSADKSTSVSTEECIAKPEKTTACTQAVSSQAPAKESARTAAKRSTPVSSRRATHVPSDGASSTMAEITTPDSIKAQAIVPESAVSARASAKGSSRKAARKLTSTPAKEVVSSSAEICAVTSAKEAASLQSEHHILLSTPASSTSVKGCACAVDTALSKAEGLAFVSNEEPTPKVTNQISSTPEKSPISRPGKEVTPTKEGVPDMNVTVTSKLKKNIPKVATISSDRSTVPNVAESIGLTTENDTAVQLPSKSANKGTSLSDDVTESNSQQGIHLEVPEKHSTSLPPTLSDVHTLKCTTPPMETSATDNSTKTHEVSKSTVPETGSAAASDLTKKPTTASLRGARRRPKRPMPVPDNQLSKKAVVRLKKMRCPSGRRKERKPSSGAQQTASSPCAEDEHNVNDDAAKASDSLPTAEPILEGRQETAAAKSDSAVEEDREGTHMVNIATETVPSEGNTRVPSETSTSGPSVPSDLLPVSSAGSTTLCPEPCLPVASTSRASDRKRKRDSASTSHKRPRMTVERSLSAPTEDETFERCYSDMPVSESGPSSEVPSGDELLAARHVVTSKSKVAAPRWRKKKYLTAGLFSDFYKFENESERPEVVKSRLVYVPSEHQHGLLPAPCYEEQWLRQRQRDFTLPYDLWWLQANAQLPGRDTLASWTYKKLRNNYYVDVKPPPYREIEACSCRPPVDPQRPGCGDDCINRMMFVECSPSSCPSGDRCDNQRIQRHRWAPGLVKFMTAQKGWGIMTRRAIRAGTFILEYVGEMVSEKEFKRRMQTRYVNDQHHYCLNLDRGMVIDGHRMGSIGRFVNHSCAPNCEMQKWDVNGLHRMALFARADVAAGAELTYDYNFSLFNPAVGQKCHCGSEECRGVIGGRNKRPPPSSRPPGAAPAARGRPRSATNHTATTSAPSAQPAGAPAAVVHTAAARRPSCDSSSGTGQDRKPSAASSAEAAPAAATEAAPREPPVRPLSSRDIRYIRLHQSFLVRNYEKMRRQREPVSAGSRPDTPPAPAAACAASAAPCTATVAPPPPLGATVGPAPPTLAPEEAFRAQLRALDAARSVRTRRIAAAEDDPETARTLKLAHVLQEIYQAVVACDGEVLEPAPLSALTLPRLPRPCAAAAPAVASPVPEPRDIADIRRLIVTGHYQSPDAFDHDFRRLFTVQLRRHGRCSGVGAAVLRLKRKYVECKTVMASQIQEILGFVPPSFRPQQKRHKDNGLDGEEDTIRCVCSLHREEGLMIQCERCLVWQHCDCVDADPAVEKYICEICEPRYISRDVQLKPQPEDAEPGLTYYLSLMRDDLQVRQGDCVYIMQGAVAKAAQEAGIIPYRYIKELIPDELLIFRVDKLWKDESGARFAFGYHYCRPQETFHEPTRRFYPREVMRSPLYEVVPLELVVGVCWVLDPNTYTKGRPVGADEQSVYICEYRVDKSARLFAKITKNRHPICTKAFAFDAFESRLRISRTYTAHAEEVEKKMNYEREKAKARRREHESQTLVRPQRPRASKDAVKAAPQPAKPETAEERHARQCRRLDGVLLRLLARMPGPAVDVSHLLDTGKRHRRRPPPRC